MRLSSSAQARALIYLLLKPVDICELHTFMLTIYTQTLSYAEWYDEAGR